MKEKILMKLQERKKDETDLAAMEYAAERSGEMMKAYCNITELPEELLGVWVSLAEMLLDRGGQSVKSIKEGDVSVTFEESVKGGKELLECFRVELDRFRRMGW